MTVDAFQLSKAHGRQINLLSIDGGYTYVVGEDGYESIEPIRVAGQGGWVTWFDIHTSRMATIRVNPRYVISVGYK